MTYVYIYTHSFKYIFHYDLSVLKSSCLLNISSMFCRLNWLIPTSHSVLPPNPSPPPASFPTTLPGAPEKGLSQSWVLFKRVYRQVNSEINAGARRTQNPGEWKRNPGSAREVAQSPPHPHKNWPLATEALVKVPPEPEQPLWLVPVFSKCGPIFSEGVVTRWYLPGFLSHCLPGRKLPWRISRWA